MFLRYLSDNLVVGEEPLCLLSEGVSDLGEGGVGPELPRNVECGPTRLRHQLGVRLQRIATSVHQLGGWRLQHLYGYRLWSKPGHQWDIRKCQFLVSAVGLHAGTIIRKVVLIRDVSLEKDSTFHLRSETP